MHAKLRFSYGTMSSGKSLRVLTTAYDFEQRKIPFIILKSVIDTRDGATTIKSRIGDGISRDCIAVKTDSDVYEIVKDYIKGNEVKWVIVDEVQFFATEQIDQLARVVDELDIDVYCFGLRTDFQTKLFPGSRRLFEIADKIEEMKSTCECGRKNMVNARIDKDGNIILDGEQNAVGGEDMYKTMCRKCYNEKIREHAVKKLKKENSTSAELRSELIDIAHAISKGDRKDAEEKLRSVVGYKLSLLKAEYSKNTVNDVIDICLPIFFDDEFIHSSLRGDEHKQVTSDRIMSIIDIASITYLRNL